MAIKVVTIEEMRAIENQAADNGISSDQLMLRAGNGLAQVILEEYSNMGRSVLALVGKGHNGGDALVALAMLARAGYKAMAYLVHPRAEGDKLVNGLRDVGGEILVGYEDPGRTVLKQTLVEVDIILDGIYGTGFRLPMPPDTASLLAFVKNNVKFALIVAIDCPSGVDCNTGETAVETIPADFTVCMQAVKIGLLELPAYEYVGELKVVDLGLPKGMETLKQVNLEMIIPDWVTRLMPDRPWGAHKGTFGKVMVVAGSINYPGAALLSSRAACLAGAGLVQAAVTARVQTLLAGHAPEVTWLILPDDDGVIAEDGYEILFKALKGTTALLVGPGLGEEPATEAFIRRLVSHRFPAASSQGIGFVPKDRRATGKNIQELPPLVFDADALKLLARMPDWHSLLPSDVILTPHPGEMSIMLGKSVKEIQANRVEMARLAARSWKKVVMLKGAFTVVAEPGGKAAILPCATPALARAGTGDVLAGIVASLRAQGMKAYDAAVSAAWIHGQAGLIAEDRIRQSASVIAGDVLQGIPEAIFNIFPE